MSRLPVSAVAACLVLVFFISACGTASANTPALPATAAPPVFETAPSAPTFASAATATEPLTPTAVSAPPTLWLPPELPAALRGTVSLPMGWALAGDPASADAAFQQLDKPSESAVSWVYALVAPFPTVDDELEMDGIKQFWQSGIAPVTALKTLLVDASTRAVFETLWGPAGTAVKTLPSDQISQAAWSDASRSTWAVIPFEALEPRWKVIAVGGQSPIRKDFQPARYGLVAYFGFTGNTQNAALEIPPGNHDSNRLTTVMLTGVTALVRGTASFMEGMGMTYPARDIGPWLREADILHISNEVPFARNCPQPFDWKDLVFCSQTEYIQLLEDVGADVIELTGDHFADWGPDAMLYTLDLYKDRGWPYYGGGANLEEAQRPALFEHNGNKIAFLGCNGKEPGYAKASATDPGAGHCDFDVMAKKIKELRAEGYQVIFTFQHLEYYQYIALPELQADFHKVSEAGAVIVSGSQAHQPHAFEFRNNALLHYGLGNLFFDQTNQGDPPRTAFIDRHVFYGGKHISTELLTIYFVDYARARPMTTEERRQMLQTVFGASVWQP